jgi:hypothetical protein
MQPPGGAPAGTFSPNTNPPTNQPAGTWAPGQWRNQPGAAGSAAPTAGSAANPTIPRTARAPAGAAHPDDGIAPIEPLRTISGGHHRKSIAKVVSGPATLPNEQGQVWREYDISPYTVRVTSTNRPEQAIVDWVLRETGYEAWHSEPLGILCANHRTLKVYHTPEMHAVVSEVVDRFVNSQADSNAFSVKVVTVGNPNWRAKSHSMLKPVAVQSQGMQAWLLQKEDAALMVAELRKRIDYREHSSPLLMVNNGQSAIVTATRPHTFIRDIIAQPNQWPNFQNEYGQFEEGFSMEFDPLLSIDGKTVDAVLKCNIDDLEKLVAVNIDVPSPAAPRQRAKIEVPQVSHCRMHERFRWPVDQVLLVGLGVVAEPTPTDPNPVLKNVPGLNAPQRSDLMVFVESKGQVATGTPPITPTAPATGLPPDRNAMRNTRGRY